MRLASLRWAILFTVNIDKAYGEARYRTKGYVSHQASSRQLLYAAKYALLTGSSSADSDKPSPVEGFPMRKWNIKIYLLNEQGEEIPATVFEKVTYKLHPTFSNPTRRKWSPCF
jgi:YEATS family